MTKLITTAYDFPHRVSTKLPPDGLPGDPDMRRQHKEELPDGPRPSHIVTGLVIVAPKTTPTNNPE